MALFYVRRDAEGIITESILALKMCRSKNFETSMSISLANGQNIVVPIMKLVVRAIPGVYASAEVPENLSREEAEKWACQYARKKKKMVCLVLSRRESVWIDEQGEIYSRTAKRG